MSVISMPFFLALFLAACSGGHGGVLNSDTAMPLRGATTSMACQGKDSQPKSSGGSGKEWEPERIARFLSNKAIETKFLNQKMSFLGFLRVIDAQIHDGEDSFKVLLDNATFSNAGYTTAEINEAQIEFGAVPKKITLKTALRLAISQLPDPKAEMYIKKGWLLIRSCPDEHSVREIVIDSFFADDTLENSLRELSVLTGTSIVIDRRVADKSKQKVQASFFNTVSLDAALLVLTDMCDLGFVVVDRNTVYITSTSNATRIKKERTPK